MAVVMKSVFGVAGVGEEGWASGEEAAAMGEGEGDGDGVGSKNQAGGLVREVTKSRSSWGWREEKRNVMKISSQR